MRELEELIQTIHGQLRLADPNLLAELPPDLYISLLDKVSAFSGYYCVTPEMEEMCGNIKRRVGEQGLESYHQLVLLYLIRDFDRRAAQCSYTDEVLDLFKSQFQRITTAMQEQTGGPYLLGDDSFLKDLGICRQRLIPCGVQVLESMSGIPRSSMLRRSSGDALRMALAVLKLGGFKPLYQFHTDRRQLREFNPKGWLRCYGRTAALLRLNPGILGVHASAWWYDPVLADISPRVAHIRKVPESFGAKFFCMGETEENTANAVVNSAERYRKYAEGIYRPKKYTILWSRRALLEAASSERWDE